MKKSFYNILLTLCLFGFSACDWVAEPTPGVSQLTDYFVSGQACIYNVNSNYEDWDINEN